MPGLLTRAYALPLLSSHPSTTLGFFYLCLPMIFVEKSRTWAQLKLNASITLLATSSRSIQLIHQVWLLALYVRILNICYRTNTSSEGEELKINTKWHTTEQRNNPKKVLWKSSIGFAYLFLNELI